jgi:hypothetical protein
MKGWRPIGNDPIIAPPLREWNDRLQDLLRDLTTFSTTSPETTETETFVAQLDSQIEVEQSAHRKFRAELTSLGLQLVESAIDDPDPIEMINAHGVGESQESLGCWNE